MSTPLAELDIDRASTMVTTAHIGTWRASWQAHGVWFEPGSPVEVYNTHTAAPRRAMSIEVVVHPDLTVTWSEVG